MQFQEEFPNPHAQLPRVCLQCYEELFRRRQLHPEEDTSLGSQSGVLWSARYLQSRPKGPN